MHAFVFLCKKFRGKNQTRPHVQGGESSARTATAGQGREGELDMTNTNLSFRFQRCPVVIIDLTVAAGRHLRRNKWPGPGAQRGREPEPRPALPWVLALDASARLQLCISQLFGSSVSLFDPTRAHRGPSQETGPGVRLHLLEGRSSQQRLLVS